MTTAFRNTQEDVQGHQIATTSDYLIEHDGQWYYWLNSTSPTENHGPYATADAALEAYNGVSDTNYSMADVADAE